MLNKDSNLNTFEIGDEVVFYNTDSNECEGGTIMGNSIITNSGDNEILVDVSFFSIVSIPCNLLTKN